MREITREEANRVIADASGGPMQKVVICYAGKWYDIRGMKDDELNKFIISLVGQDVFDKGQVSIEVKL
jgi:hypothetical protein